MLTRSVYDKRHVFATVCPPVSPYSPRTLVYKNFYLFYADSCLFYIKFRQFYAKKKQLYRE